MAGPRQGKRDKSDGKGARILIVEARFYEAIADALLAGATRALEQAQATFDRISVPGSLEIPTAIALRSMRRDAGVGRMTARWRSAASFAARPFISRSSRTNRRAG